MEENLEPNTEVNEVISDNTKKPFSEGINETKSEKGLTKNDDNAISNEDIQNANDKTLKKIIAKPKKELPIEKKTIPRICEYSLNSLTKRRN